MSSESESESDDDLVSPFRFFDLPPELRRKILHYVFHVDRVLDIDFVPTHRLAILTVSERFREEAGAAFYSSNKFRLLPTHGNAVARRARPLIKCIAQRYRFLLIFMEFRLGPFWTQPPQCWKIDDSLGLEDATGVRVLNIFVEIDPSVPMFKGFRKSKNFYTEFTGNLLRQILRRLPSLIEVRLDGYPSVFRDGRLVQRLVNEVISSGKRVSWGSGLGMRTSGEENEKTGFIQSHLESAPHYAPALLQDYPS